MSRNLMRTDCEFCQSAVKLTEAPREVTEADVGIYIETRDGFGFRGMIAANAECTECEAKYLAWVSLAACDGYSFRHLHDHCGDRGFFDLSFRSTFNDEPGEADMPKWKVERIVTLVKTPWAAPCATESMPRRENVEVIA